MATITVRVSDEEKAFLDQMAKFENKSLSELLKTSTLEMLEDKYDAQLADQVYGKYLGDTKSKPLNDVMKEYGLDEKI